MPMNEKYSDDELINYLKAAASGDRLSYYEFREYYKDREEVPHPQTYSLRFGSWSDAIEEADLECAARGSSVKMQRFFDFLESYIWDEKALMVSEIREMAESRGFDSFGNSKRWVARKLYNRGSDLDYLVKRNGNRTFVIVFCSGFEDEALDYIQDFMSEEDQDG